MVGLGLSQQLYPPQSKKEKGTAAIGKGQEGGREILGPVGHTVGTGEHSQEPEGRACDQQDLGSESYTHVFYPLHSSRFLPVLLINNGLAPSPALCSRGTSARGHSSLQGPPRLSPSLEPGEREKAGQKPATGQAFSGFRFCSRNKELTKQLFFFVIP